MILLESVASHQTLARLYTSTLHKRKDHTTANLPKLQAGSDDNLITST